MSSPELTPRVPVAPGDVLAGKYYVQRVLGVGGMGIVVAAKHLQLDELVALKFLQRRVMDEPDVVARFLREARAVAKLKNEHVVRVRDVGSLDDGAPYIVMELLEGETLKDRLKRGGPLPVSEAVDYTLQACEALAEAHAHRMVHRDIKPTNMFLTRRADGTPLVKVFDFGISKVHPTGPDAEAELGMTSGTSMLGSPLYMSPEQMIPSRTVDARSDIWSLGVSLFVLLSGALPFRGATMPEVCAMVLGHRATTLDTVLPTIPRGVAEIVARCLEKDPRARFQNVAELAAALEAYGSAASAGASRRVAGTLEAQLGVGGAPPSSQPPSSVLSMTSSSSTGSAPLAAARTHEETDVTFGEASRSPRASRARVGAKTWGAIAAGLVFAVAFGLLALSRLRATSETVPSAGINLPPAAPAAQPAPRAPSASTVLAASSAPPAVVPPSTPRSATDADPSLSATGSAPRALRPSPVRPRPALAASSPASASDPNSYR